jgi:hypothetical protein
MKILNSNFFLLSVILVIPLLITGPFLPDLIISLSSIIFLSFVYKKKKFYFFNNRPIIIFFIFCIYCILISIFVADNISLSLQSSLFYFRFGIFACIIWYLIERDKKILNYFYYVLIFTFFLLVVDGYMQYFLGYNITGNPKSIRISSLFGDEWILGSYVSRFYPLAFALFLLREIKKFEIFFITLLFVLVGGLIFVSGERTAFFFYILSNLFILIFIKKLFKIRLLIFFGSILLVASLTLTNDRLQYRVFGDPIKSMGIKKETEKKYIFTEGHESLILTALNMFKDKPVFGHGPKMFRVICKNQKYAIGVSPCMTHPHNFYIQLLAEIGFVGFMFLFSVFIYIIYCSIRQFKTIIFKEKRYLNDYQVCLLACILITVWPLSPNGNFFNNWLSICYSLPFGFYLHSLYGKNKEEIDNN